MDTRGAITLALELTVAIFLVAMILGQLLGQPVLLGFVTSESMSPTLETRTRNAVSPGTSVTVPFAVDAPQARNRTARIEDSLGDPPGNPQFAIVTTVSLSGTVNGQSVDRTEEYLLPVTFEDVPTERDRGDAAVRGDRDCHGSPATRDTRIAGWAVVGRVLANRARWTRLETRRHRVERRRA